MTKTFQIYANATDMGQYEAVDAKAAILDLTKDAGYDSIEEAAEVLSKTAEEYVAEFEVVEV